jgi:fructose-1,6-bisphosphatase/inositol monophosphatase family enzyme
VVAVSLMPMADPNFRPTNPELFEAVAKLIRSVAAEQIMPRRRHLLREQINEKTPGDLVTIADHEAEARLTEALAGLIPGSRVVGEEAVSADPGLLDGLDRGCVWLVDPLDGTGNFVAGSPHFAVMVALLQGGVVEAGWIFQPAHGLFYVAERSRGAFCNGSPVRAQPSGQSGLIGAFPTRYANASQRQLIDKIRADVDVALPGLMCAGVDYTRCIDGTQDFAVFWRSLPWDHAPGALILAEAGGWAGWMDGAPYSVCDQRPGLVARGPHVSLF